MNSRTILSMIIIVVVVFSMITYYRMQSYPEGDCCRDIKNVDSDICQKCEDYNLFEKIYYVWRFPS